jgi:hypothetical protein
MYDWVPGVTVTEGTAFTTKTPPSANISIKVGEAAHDPQVDRTARPGAGASCPRAAGAAGAEADLPRVLTGRRTWG